MTLAGLPLNALAQRCAEETERYRRREANDQQFCFELLRRALGDELHDAFTRVYQIYERQALSWVYSHASFARSGEDADYFARAAMSAFYFALRGPRFARFPALAPVLAYLKVCVHSAIVQYLRDQPPADEPLTADADAAYTPELGERAAAADLWREVCRLLPDEQDQLLARYVLLQDLAPRQIVAAAPGVWADERAVTVATYRIRRVLRNSDSLRQIAGVPNNDGTHERGV